MDDPAPQWRQIPAACGGNWAGVARYKATGDAAALKDTAERFKKRYADSTWAKKASVWAP